MGVAKHSWANHLVWEILKIAVEELGGPKFKSGGQIYEGVRLPAVWRTPLAQSA